MLHRLTAAFLAGLSAK